MKHIILHVGAVYGGIMAHFKISLAGQLHFAPQAGDWASLFVLFLYWGSPPTSIPTIHHQKDMVAVKGWGQEGLIQGGNSAYFKLPDSSLHMM